MNETSLFADLVYKIVTLNGGGHAELQKLVTSGDVTKELAELILLAASVAVLDKKLSSVLSKFA